MPEREIYFDRHPAVGQRSNPPVQRPISASRHAKSGFSREREKRSREKHETKMGYGGADMAVELEAGLNADRDPTSQFVTQGEKRGTGYV